MDEAIHKVEIFKAQMAGINVDTGYYDGSIEFKINIGQDFADPVATSENIIFTIPLELLLIEEGVERIAETALFNCVFNTVENKLEINACQTPEGLDYQGFMVDYLENAKNLIKTGF